MHKFEKLEVWQLSIEYIDLCYSIADQRSLMETVACQHLIFRRQYLPDPALLREAYQASDTLAAKLQAMRRALSANHTIGEAPEEYDFDLGNTV